MLIMKVCNAMNPSTIAVEGFTVLHFGKII